MYIDERFAGLSSMYNTMVEQSLNPLLPILPTLRLLPGIEPLEVRLAKVLGLAAPCQFH